MQQSLQSRILLSSVLNRLSSRSLAQNDTGQVEQKDTAVFWHLLQKCHGHSHLIDFGGIMHLPIDALQVVCPATRFPIIQQQLAAIFTHKALVVVAIFFFLLCLLFDELTRLRLFLLFRFWFRLHLLL